MTKAISDEELHLNSMEMKVDLTYGFKKDIALKHFKTTFERLAYFQLIREIGHHNVKSRRASKNKDMNKMIKWTNASQSRQVFTRVMAMIKMQDTWKSVTEVASLCNITTKALRTMIEDATNLGLLERCPDTHYVRANDYSVGIWFKYVQTLYDEDEKFIRQFFNTVDDYYRAKEVCKLADYEEVTSHLFREIR